MVESRCGLLCNKYKYHKIMKYKGYLKIKKPYWGRSCPIKTCVEGKNLTHCGQCQRFPDCKKLHEFAFDPATGSEGTRFDVLTGWLAEETVSAPQDAQIG